MSGRLTDASNPESQMMLYILPELSTSNIRLGGTAGEVNKGTCAGVKA
ncbi:hypothetical protein ALP29_201727 [Pseudomonas syringae pv. avii]|uniref:Uncharacterized protein n=1 Tax=Pseudomonas syringae pv. avii TaxID=663959 RepID=A0A3M5VHB0_PSESX|nr:hypothetical protein ALP29_201727 [Pseudomonas syringae pv. avii]